MPPMTAPPNPSGFRAAPTAPSSAAKPRAAFSAPPASPDAIAAAVPFTEAPTASKDEAAFFELSSIPSRARSAFCRAESTSFPPTATSSTTTRFRTSATARPLLLPLALGLPLMERREGGVDHREAVDERGRGAPRQVTQRDPRGAEAVVGGDDLPERGAGERLGEGAAVETHARD